MTRMDADLGEDLRRFRRGGLSEAKLLTRIRASLRGRIDAENLGFARLDHDREARKGFPEVVYGEGKTPDQIEAIAARLLARSGRLLITRAPESVYLRLRARFPRLRYQPQARAIYSEDAVDEGVRDKTAGRKGAPGRSAHRTAERKRTAPLAGRVLVVCAGTTDIPVAEEAALTARLLGCTVETLHDVGVAGLHRLLSQTPRLRRASVIIAVAGMEGALPSVIAGLVDKPVIGVPTSVGYGASLKGMAALLALLNSCAAGLTVVNIDNGFGAGFAAAQILRMAQGNGGGTGNREVTLRGGGTAGKRAGKGPAKNREATGKGEAAARKNRSSAKGKAKAGIKGRKRR